MTCNDTDVAEILRQLKREVREQYREGQRAAPLSRMAAMEEVHAASWVNPHHSIAWPHWPGGLWPKIVALAQKVIRRLLRWYINPLVAEQNRFNAAVTTALDALAQENTQLRAELKVVAENRIDNSGGVV